MHEALCWILQHYMKPGMRCTPIILACQWIQEDQEFKILISYIVSSSQLGLYEILPQNKICPWIFIKVCCPCFRFLSRYWVSWSHIAQSRLKMAPQGLTELLSLLGILFQNTASRVSSGQHFPRRIQKAVWRVFCDAPHKLLCATRCSEVSVCNCYISL